ncbi:MAG TPA: phosphoglucosamine mutase, partial [Nitrosomonas sp.]|nr:phosphoglucosamine mutase [Nitrosomonas sp.]
EVKTVVKNAESDLNAQGRVLLRASGTEPLIRVMVEGESDKKVNFWAEQISDVIRNICKEAVD